MPFVIYSERLAQESAKQYAYRILRRNILLLDMKPGEAIVEKDISAKLRLSRTPVREALLDLCRERLVEIYPQRGTRVALMDARLVDQGRFLRETVELALLELACKSFTEEHLAKLEANLAEQEHEVEQGDLINFFFKDNEFHRILFASCNKDTVFDAISFYMPHFTRERMLRLQMFNPSELICDHRNIMTAIKAGDCRTAKMHLSEHLDHVMCDQQILLEGYPEYFIREEHS
ncbi:MAG: GntR family transcriptional regulator [Sphaerochaetaceae bacterium]|nr:GntR family transcriptional regulator [Sphaerochaetaceae bacterium]